MLTIIPDCTEAIAFHLRVIIAAHVGAGGQIQSLKSVIVHALLVVIVKSIILLRFRFGTEPYPLCKKGSSLCNKCQRKEQEREIRKGLLISERNWLHKF